MERYGRILNKRKREIVLLRGSGCIYKKCAFCDYHLDKCADDDENFRLNREVISRVTGEFNELEVINSGSVFELDTRTLNLVKAVCKDKGIDIIHFEAHYLYESRIPALREFFKDFQLKMKLGLETFDYDLRENVLKKGIPEKNPSVISRSFDEANFLIGIDGQTEESMRNDIVLGLDNFERICLNVMCENSTAIKPNKAVIDIFLKEIYPEYKDDERVDILINNTDFGVGD
ncbi:MAG: hypothetical protein NC037_06450 [Bacteroides sp.]|nr:radical SAM protein [Bacillota bacterium]MCM1394005.1 radical SAM protein [[Eubacterium] siraeum]MCM1456145.1 hypothetical protein [Bacteroides sp.]